MNQQTEIWEKMHNPDFKGGEFETFKKEAELIWI